jgi:hypothetical protein
MNTCYTGRVITTTNRNSESVSRSQIEALVIELKIAAQIDKSHVLGLSTLQNGPPCMTDGLLEDVCSQ